MTRRDDEFYVGYMPRSPRGIAARSRAAAALALALGVVLSLILAWGQLPFDAGVFEFGVERVFEGIVVERPYPLLLVPGEIDSGNGFVTYYLVAFGKHGAEKLVAGMDAEPARVTGSLIHNEKGRMIEAHRVERVAGATADHLRRLRDRGEQRIGRMTLVGEIVDSKCHLGVMKPGRGKPHKACAIRCLSGGIPPVLRVEDRSGRVDYFLLVSSEGHSVNHAVLDMIAEPVEITGDVSKAGDLLVLYADPATYRRLGHGG